MPISGSGTVSSVRPGPGGGLHEGEHRRSCFRGLRRRPASRSGGRPRVVGPVDDRILHRADALDLAPHAVAGLEEHGRVAEHADAGRRAGGDEVAGLEGDLLRDEADEGRARRTSGPPSMPSCIGIAVPASGPLPGMRHERSGRPAAGSTSSGVTNTGPIGQERVAALGAQPLAVALLALAERRRRCPASRGR